MYEHLLPHYAERGLHALTQFWNHAPHAIQTNTQLLAHYVQCLINIESIPTAEKILRKSLQKIWDPDLMRLYGQLEGVNPKDQKNFADSFIHQHPEEPQLLLALGRIYARNQLWPQAQSFLEHSLAIKPLTETYAALGTLMETLSMDVAKQEYFKKGLQLANQAHPPERYALAPPSKGAYIDTV